MDLTKEWTKKRESLNKSLKKLHKQLDEASDSDILTMAEKVRVVRAGTFLDTLLLEWDSKNESSKRQYLKQEEKKL